MTLVLGESDDPTKQTAAQMRFGQAVQERSDQTVAWSARGGVMAVPISVKVSDDLPPAIQVWSATTRALTIFEGAYLSAEVHQWKIAGIEVMTGAEAERRFQLRDAARVAVERLQAATH